MGLHLDVVLAFLHFVFLQVPVARCLWQCRPVVWLGEFEFRPYFWSALHGLLDGPSERHARAPAWSRVGDPAVEELEGQAVAFHARDVSGPTQQPRLVVPSEWSNFVPQIREEVSHIDTPSPLLVPVDSEHGPHAIVVESLHFLELFFPQEP